MEYPFYRLTKYDEAQAEVAAFQNPMEFKEHHLRKPK